MEAVGLDRFDDERSRRKRLGAWYTPHPLVDEITRRAIPDEIADGRVLTVVDPACGDGRFLAAAARRITSLGGRPRLVGVDIDPAAVERARRALSPWSATIVRADALMLAWPGLLGDGGADVAVGNPPFLSQLSSATARGGSSVWGGGPYADAAVEFLALAARMVRAGGRIGLVLPQSVIASRDAAAVRRDVATAGSLRWLWWSSSPIFDAQVRTCAVVVDVGRVDRPPVELSEGLEFASRPPAMAPPSGDAEWGRLFASALGVPPLPDGVEADGTLDGRATAHLDFRDEYYGLVPAVAEAAGHERCDRPDAATAPLVTSGLIDPAVCAWGVRPVRFAKRAYDAPVVVLDRLDEPMRQWAASRLVPKVLVASQTRVIEAVVDQRGAWLPGVPVVTVVPRRAAGDALWDLAAVLTSPVASAALCARSAGNALSTHAVRITPSALCATPWPAGDLAGARAALRAGDVVGCGRAACAAYGLASDIAADLISWWERSLPRRMG